MLTLHAKKDPEADSEEVYRRLSEENLRKMSIKASKVMEEEVDFRKLSEAHDERVSEGGRGAFHKKDTEPVDEPQKR